MSSYDVFSPVTSAGFRNAMSDLPAAISLITTLDEAGQPRGATVSAVSSLSLEPPLVLVCLDRGSDTLTALPEAHQFILHIAADGQQDVAYALARKGEDKFSMFDWSLTADGLPLIHGCTLAMHCVVEALLPGGDHTIVVGLIDGIAHDTTSIPIIYHRRQMFPASAQIPTSVTN